MSGLVLGLSASHCGSACLLREGEVLAAVAEERLSGRKKDRIFAGRPSLAVQAVLELAGVDIGEVELAVVCTQESRRLPEHDLAQNAQLKPLVERRRVRFLSHHLGHAYAVFGGSGFDEAAILIADGRGSPLADLEAPSASLCGQQKGDEVYSILRASDGDMRPLWKQLMEPATRGWDRRGLRPHDSCGALFEAVGEFTFGDVDSAGKVMALAAFGEPRFSIDRFFDLTDEAILARDDLASEIAALAEQECGEHGFEQLKADLACSAQRAVESVISHLAQKTKQLSGSRRLCWSGGVALNCVLNERLIRQSGFDEVFVLPASDDRGVSIGAAYFGDSLLGGSPRPRRRIRSDAWGLDAIASSTVASKTVASETGRGELTGRDLAEPDFSPLPQRLFQIEGTSGRSQTALRLADELRRGRVVGVFSGRAELGPRALGHRSILGDARSARTKDRMNASVKGRESFRPFGPAVLEERAAEWFDLPATAPTSRFMLRAVPIKPERLGQIPGAAHVDGGARIQTVPASPPTLLRHVLDAFEAETGVPILLNTSFNLAGEPIVEEAIDALWMLLLTDLDWVAFDHCLVASRVATRDVLGWRLAVPGAVRRQLGGTATEREIRIDTAYGPTRQLLYRGLVASLQALEDGRQVRELVSPPEEVSAVLGQLGVLRRRGLLEILPEPVP